MSSWKIANGKPPPLPPSSGKLNQPNPGYEHAMERGAELQADQTLMWASRATRRLCLLSIEPMKEGMASRPRFATPPPHLT